MNTKKILTKYLILLLGYSAIVNFIEPYILKIYYTINANPQMSSQTVYTIQSIFTTTNFLINLLISIFIFIDSKNKIVIDWLIILISLINPFGGITLFIIWQIYKDIKKYEA